MSLPGLGPLTGTECLVETGKLDAFEAVKPAVYAGLVPPLRDSR
ncbi:MAG: transposase [Actinomycetota bacterium]